MEKVDQIKRIIRQLIDENDFLLAAITIIKQRDGRLPTIDLSDSRGSVFVKENLCVVMFVLMKDKLKP